MCEFLDNVKLENEQLWNGHGKQKKKCAMEKSGKRFFFLCCLGLRVFVCIFT